MEVIQIRSPIGTHQRRKNAARLATIRLGKIRQSTIGFSDDLAFMGNVRRLDGIVEVVPLARPQDTSQRRRSGGTTLTVEDYRSGQVTGEVLKFSNGEYMIVEQQAGESYALAWSSALPVHTLVMRTLRLLDKYSSFTSGVVRFSDGRYMDGKAKQIIGTITESPERVRFFRLDSDQFSFGWKARVAVHDDYPQIDVNECGFSSYNSFDRALCKQLVERSATDQLGTEVEVSIAKVSDFLRKESRYGRGVMKSIDGEAGGAS